MTLLMRALEHARIGEKRGKEIGEEQMRELVKRLIEDDRVTDAK